jgi:stage II sporulation protein P
MGMGAILPMDLSLSGYGIDYIYNTSTKSPDMAALGAYKVSTDISGIYPSYAPLVLIVHTHGTECYNSYRNDAYIADVTPLRSENISENVVGVGKKLTEVLNGFGIPTIHSEKMCDKESFVNAYAESFSEVQSYLDKYPSIRFVIDLHRDAIESPDGSQTKPVYDIFGNKTAQLMFVVGTNQAGADHPAWQDNLALAMTLQSEIGKTNPDLFRRINLRSASFNQQRSNGDLLLECGSSANTLEEAEKAAELFATGLARIITDYAC